MHGGADLQCQYFDNKGNAVKVCIIHCQTTNDNAHQVLCIYCLRSILTLSLDRSFSGQFWRSNLS